MYKSTIENVDKIAILRTNQGLGDLIVCLPAFRALKNTYPSAHIILLGLQWHQQFLRQRPVGIDRVICVPNSLCLTNDEFEENETLERKFFDLLKIEKIDIFINFQAEVPISSIIQNEINPRVSVGQEINSSSRYDRSIPFFYYQSEVLRYLHLVDLIGAESQNIEPSFPLLPIEVTVSISIIKQFQSHHKFVIIHPSAKDIRRRWPTSKFAILADKIIKLGYEVLLIGNNDEAHIIKEVKNKMTQKPVLISSLSLGLLAGVQHHSQLVISNDTGPLHLARAVNSPSVGLYWAPNVINWGALKQNKHSHVISWELRCPGCGIIPNQPYPFEPKTAECEHLFSFIDSITVEEVFHTAKRILKL